MKIGVFSHSRDIQVKRIQVLTSQNGYSNKTNHKIKNISGNFEELKLKFGTSNVP